MRKAIILLLALSFILVAVAGCSPAPESKDTRYPYEYLGMTFGELKELWGEDCDSHEPISNVLENAVWYKDGRTPFLFVFDDALDIESVQDNDIIAEVFVKGGEAAITEEILGEESDRVLNRLYTVTDSWEFDPWNPEEGEWLEIRIKDLMIGIRFFYFSVNEFQKLDYWAPPSYVSVRKLSKEEQENTHWHNEPWIEYSEHPITGEMVWFIENEETGYLDAFIEDPETGEMIPYEYNTDF